VGPGGAAVVGKGAEFRVSVGEVASSAKPAATVAVQVVAGGGDAARTVVAAVIGDDGVLQRGGAAVEVEDAPFRAPCWR